MQAQNNVLTLTLYQSHSSLTKLINILLCVDIAVGAPYEVNDDGGNMGAVYVYYGSANGIMNMSSYDQVRMDVCSSMYVCKHCTYVHAIHYYSYFIAM